MDRPRNLQTSVDDLADEVAALRTTMRSRTRALWAALFVGAVLLALLGNTMLDNRDAIAENNRRWCPLVVELAPRPGDPEPAGTAEQKARAYRVRDGLTRLARDFGCT